MSRVARGRRRVLFLKAIGRRGLSKGRRRGEVKVQLVSVVGKITRINFGEICVSTSRTQQSGAHLHHGSGFSYQPTVPRAFLTSTTSSNDGLKIPTTKRARWCFINVRCVHIRFEPRKRHLWHSTSSNCPRFRCRSPDYDSGTFPPPS